MKAATDISTTPSRPAKSRDRTEALPIVNACFMALNEGVLPWDDEPEWREVGDVPEVDMTEASTSRLKLLGLVAGGRSQGC